MSNILDDSGHVNDMTLRVWLAGMAMQGILSCEQTHPKTSQCSNEEIAVCCFELADAMIEQSKITPSNG